MSSLIFHTIENEAWTATDTLATSVDGEAAFFTTKAFIVAHLRMIICGTGIAGFLGRWFIEINDRMVVDGIDHLDYHTPKTLPGLWRKYKDEFQIPDNQTSTIYQFGFSEADDLIHPYAYRSLNNFTSERLPYGLGVKPGVQLPDQCELLRDVKKIMDAQKLAQRFLPKNERVYIGGKIQIHNLNRDGFAVFTLDQFEDYESTRQAIYKNYDAKKQRIVDA